MIVLKPQRKRFSRKGGTEIHEGARAHKYKAKRTEFGDRSFPSQLQANTFGLLRILEAAGEVSDIEHEVEIRLEPFGIIMRVDFVIFDRKLNEKVYVESKGFPTADWKVKVKVWSWVGPGLYRIYRDSRGGYPEISKEIRPAWMLEPNPCTHCSQPIWLDAKIRDALRSQR
jgi:hypothetical protein